MKTDLYVFSGTGNSLAVARRLSEGLERSSLHLIPDVITRENSVTGERIGIVCPIYMHFLPHIVVRFIEKIDKADDLFIVLAGGGETGGAVGRLKKLLRQKGLSASVIYNITMPSNYTPYGVPSPQKQKEYLAHAEQGIQELLTLLKKGEPYIYRNPKALIQSIFPGLLYRMGWKYITYMGKNFTVEESCTNCGICEKICPVGNITINDGKPQWGQQCEQCFACLQWCPALAIQYGDKTKNVGRYHHPEVTLKDLMASR